MIIQEYRRAASLEEAYELIAKGRANRIIGGCTFLKRTRMRIKTAVDLIDCGLDYIKDEADCVRIGAYTSLREIETSGIVREVAGDMLYEAVKHLIGVQLRSQITIGAHVASRFGFSDIIPTLLALNAKVVFYKGGERSLWDYMQETRTPKTPRDILTEIVLPKEGRIGKTQMMRLSYADYSILCIAVSHAPASAGEDGTQRGGWIVAGGNFPGLARLAEPVMEKLNAMSAAEAAAEAERIAGETARYFTFGSNYRGSAEYRRELCRVFVRRAVEEIASAESGVTE